MKERMKERKNDTHSGFLLLDYTTLYSPSTLCRILIISHPVLRKILSCSFRVVENLHCNFRNGENSNCIKYQKVLSTLWKLSGFLPQNYSNFLTVTIHIVNHLEHFFHISSIEGTDLRGLPQIFPQSAKFLPRACSRRSRKIPSLNKTIISKHPVEG